MIPLGLTAAASATVTGIQNKTFSSGMTALKISNQQMKDIIKIVKSLEKSALFIKGVHLKLDVQGQRCGRILNVGGQGGWGVLKIGQFSWLSYVYHP